MKKINIYSFLLAAVLLANNSKVQAQDFGFGFKAGLNYSNLNAVAEKDDNGKAVEKFGFDYGFHVGATGSLKFTDDFGLRLELLYSQKNSTYQYDGQAFRIYQTGAAKVYATGILKTNLLRSNSYIDIPLNAYYRIGRKLEVSAGGYFSALVGSTATGDITFEGKTDGGTPIVAKTLMAKYNYLSDKAGEGVASDGSSTFFADGFNFSQPNTVGAYYDFAKKDGNFFKGIDIGLSAGLAYYFNQSLYFSLRAQYGLIDITNNNYDFQQTKSNKYTLTPRQDKDTNLTIQASVGFGF